MPRSNPFINNSSGFQSRGWAGKAQPAVGGGGGSGSSLKGSGWCQSFEVAMRLERLVGVREREVSSLNPRRVSYEVSRGWGARRILDSIFASTQTNQRPPPRPPAAPQAQEGDPTGTGAELWPTGRATSQPPLESTPAFDWKRRRHHSHSTAAGTHFEVWACAYQSPELQGVGYGSRACALHLPRIPNLST